MYPSVLYMPPQNFQSSFIPKKSLSEEHPVEEESHFTIISFIGILIFIVSLALAGGAYFYKNSLINQLAEKQSQLSSARNALEPTLIADSKILAKRLSAVNKVLGNHIVVSPIFEALQINTLKTIQFTSFDYSISSASAQDPVSIKMSGRARDYASIALEADQLAKNKDIKNPVFSDLTYDDQTGSVSFSLVFTVGRDLVDFSKHTSSYEVKPTNTNQ